MIRTSSRDGCAPYHVHNTNYTALHSLDEQHCLDLMGNLTVPIGIWEVSEILTGGLTRTDVEYSRSAGMESLHRVLQNHPATRLDNRRDSYSNIPVDPQFDYLFQMKRSLWSRLGFFPCRPFGRHIPPLHTLFASTRHGAYSTPFNSLFSPTTLFWFLHLSPIVNELLA